MNTPTHVIFNLLVLGRGGKRDMVAPVLAGALLPDLSILVFYLVEKFRGTAEPVIWSEAYYSDTWQHLLAPFHSIPLMALLLALGLWLKSEKLRLFVSSMALHVLLDFPFHHGDAHAHFFPFSNWRFESPLSYWNPQYHGKWVGSFEALLGLAGTVILFRRYPSVGARLATVAVALVYAAYVVFAFWIWA